VCLHCTRDRTSGPIAEVMPFALHKCWSIHRATWLAACLVLGSGALAPLGGEVVEGAKAPRESVVYRITPAGSAITVDGVLDEPAWDSALTVRLEYETRPGENTAPPVVTECLVT
jgi:hypothetical protein